MFEVTGSGFVPGAPIVTPPPPTGMISKIGSELTAFSESIFASTPGLVPQIVGLQNGEFIIVWTNTPSTTQSSLAGLFDQTGTRYFTFPSFNYQWLSAAELSNGDLAFSKEDAASSNASLITTLTTAASSNYDSNGSTFEFNGGTLTTFYGLSMSNGSGIAEAGIEVLGSGNSEVLLQIGAGATPKVVSGPSTSISGAIPEVVQLSGGNYAVAWGATTAFHVSILSSTGTLLNDQAFALPEVLGSDLAFVPQLGMAPSLDNKLAITESVSGQIFFWEMNQSNFALMQQVVSPASETHDFAPAVTTLSNGDLVVGWYNANNDALEGQLLSPTGTALGSVFQIATDVPSIQPYISLTSLGNGKFAAAWSTDSGSTAQVEYQMFATSNADLLWQDTDGQASIWDMNGSALVGGGAVSPNPGLESWTEIGTGDFNHDGHADILWRNASGQAAVWDMNGNSLIAGGPVTPNPGPSWKAIGTGDFTDDGFSDDILFQNTSGQASIWEMSGNILKGGGLRRPIRVLPGKRSGQAISTRTAFPTFFGRTRARARFRSGK